MNLKKTMLLTVLLLFLAVATGCDCNEGHARRSSTRNERVVLEPSVTGFWQTRVIYADANFDDD